MHFDVVDMRLVVNTAETRSLTRAADLVHLSVAAASKRIKQLEERFGARLLHRSSHGTTLTAPGEAFAHHARILLAQVQLLRSDLRPAVDDSGGRVRIAANSSLVGEYLPALLGRFLRRYPRVSIEFRDLVSSDAKRAVDHGETDLAIVAAGTDTADLTHQPFLCEPLSVVSATDHPFAQADTLTVEDLRKQPLVGLRGEPLQWIAGPVPAPSIEVSDFETLCRMVEAGTGIGILPESAARRHRRTLQIAVRSLRAPPPKLELRLIMRDPGSLPAPARELQAMLHVAAETAQETRAPCQDTGIEKPDRWSIVGPPPFSAGQAVGVPLIET